MSQERTIQSVEQERNNAIFQLGLAEYNRRLNEEASNVNFFEAKKLQAEVHSLRQAAQGELTQQIQAVGAASPPARG